MDDGATGTNMVPGLGCLGGSFVTLRRSRTDLHRRAIALLDQQLWCWGRDIACPEGNVLLDLGMCRYRSGNPGLDRTAYSARVAGDGVVWLWGFGLMYCLPDLGGIFLRRYRFDPVLVNEPSGPIHALEHIGSVVRPTTARQRAITGELVRAAAKWIAGYEHWVAETLGAAYREATLAARDKPPVIPAKEMTRAWEHLAKKSVRLSDLPSEPRGPWGRVLTALRTPAVVMPRHSKAAYLPNVHKRFPT